MTSFEVSEYRRSYFFYNLPLAFWPSILGKCIQSNSAVIRWLDDHDSTTLSTLLLDDARNQNVIFESRQKHKLIKCELAANVSFIVCGLYTFDLYNANMPRWLSAVSRCTLFSINCQISNRYFRISGQQFTPADNFRGSKLVRFCDFYCLKVEFKLLSYLVAKPLAQANWTEPKPNQTKPSERSMQTEPRSWRGFLAEDKSIRPWAAEDAADVVVVSWLWMKAHYGHLVLFLVFSLKLELGCWPIANLPYLTLLHL